LRNRKTRFCSSECMKQYGLDKAKAYRKTDEYIRPLSKDYKHICEVCGHEYTNRSLHSTRCAKCLKIERSKPRHVTMYRNCLCCGKEFKVKVRHPEQEYCCRSCGAMRTIKEVIPKVKHYCIVCGKEIIGQSRMFCSDECRKENARLKFQKHKKTKQYREELNRQNGRYVPKPGKVKICEYCRKEFKTNRPEKKYCSKQCRSKAYYSSETKREERRRYRARKVNAYVSRVVTKDTYKRDKGICQICGKPIDLKYKSPHPMSLTIDHIIPLSLGGTHEPKNVQIAHMICNSTKGNRGVDGGEQLRIL